MVYSKGGGENVMALLGSITVFEKRYCVMEVHNAFFLIILLLEISALCVMDSFSERYCVMEIHNASSKTLLCYGQFLGTLLRYWRS